MRPTQCPERSRAACFLSEFALSPAGSTVGAKNRAEQRSRAHYDLGPSQLRQCPESTLVLARTRTPLSSHRCRHGLRKEPRARISNDESQWPGADAGGWRLRAVGVQLDHALPRARLSATITALSALTKNPRRRRPLARLDSLDLAAGRSPRILGAGANPPRAAGHGRDSERCGRRGRAVENRRKLSGQPAFHRRR